MARRVAAGSAAWTVKAGHSDLVLVWDRWSGWGHLAAPEGTTSAQPRFVGLVNLPAANVSRLHKLLDQAGFEVCSEYSVDDQLLELRLTELDR